MDDWRLNGQEKYLFGKRLLRIAFFENDDVDHMHCSFCWTKFSKNEDDLHHGYATFDGYHIICEECFQDFKDQFQWKVDDRIVGFEDYIRKRKTFFRKKFFLHRFEKNENEERCGICGASSKEKQSFDKTWLRSADSKEWLCQTCVEDFSPVFEFTLSEKY